MALPQIVQDAIVEETVAGQKREELNAQLQALSSSKDAAIADLKAQIAAGSPDVVALTAKIAELEKNSIDATELVTAIKAINPAPVSNAVITSVIDSPTITTPPAVVAAPAVAPGVVQTPAVVQAAVSAISDAPVPSKPEVPSAPVAGLGTPGADPVIQKP